MGLYQRKRSPNWWLTYYAYGERIQESSGTRSKAEATILLQRRKKELREGTWRHPRNRGISFSEIVSHYYESLAFISLGEKTKRFYTQRIDKLLDHFGTMQVLGLTRNDVQTFIKKRAKETSQTTIHHEMTTLFTILKWAARESVITHVPFATERLKPTRNEFRGNVLSVEEEKRILRVAQPYQQAMIIAALDAGMHKKEIFGQLWKDVDLVRGIITMTASKKGREGRIVPLTARFREVLEGLPKNSAHVFTFKDAPILSDTKRGWYRILEDAKVTGIRFHDLRATYGTRLEELNVPPVVSMALMGHKRKTDAHNTYIRPQLPALREAIKKLDSWLAENELNVTSFTPADPKKVVRIRQ